MGTRGSWAAVQISQEAWNTEALREGLGPDAWPGGECMDDHIVLYCFLPIRQPPRLPLAAPQEGTVLFSNMLNPASKQQVLGTFRARKASEAHLSHPSHFILQETEAQRG